MKAELINPFLTSVVNTFQTMLDCSLERTDLRLNTGDCPEHEISALIGLSGKGSGMVVLSLSKNVATKAASTMLMMEITEINEDVTDAVGELVNMIGGAAKAQLEELEMSLSLPSVITGKGHDVTFPLKIKPIYIGLTSPWGPLSMVVGLAVEEALVSA
jgi:chemotaxis protein CheX